MRKIAIRSLEYLSVWEADAYLEEAAGDELTAAYLLATDRNTLDGSSKPPDEYEVHHSLFLLRRCRGLEIPSFDSIRIQLRRRAAA